MTGPSTPFPRVHQLPALVGREREQRRLDAWLSEMLGGNGRLILIQGEAGIGKTALVERIAVDAQRRGAQILTGYCYDRSLPAPYGPWIAALARADLDVGLPAVWSDAQREALSSELELFGRVESMLVKLSERQPVLLILEDLHWSDPASLLLLQHIGRSVAARHLLIVATYRGNTLGRAHPLFDLLPDLTREGQTGRIDLSALTAAETRELVALRYDLSAADEARLAAHLYHRAVGNPLFTTEVLRSLEHERLLRTGPDGWVLDDLSGAPLPPLVQQLIERRLAQFAARERELLDLAAVIGADVPVALWRQASQDDADLTGTLERALQTGLLVEANGGIDVRFSHALVRETLYQGIPLSRLQQLHLRVAEILSRYVDPPASVVAAHFVDANDPLALVWLVRAGERALALYAAQDAIAAFSAACALAQRAGQPPLLEAFRGRASAYAMRGEFERARHDLETVLERARAVSEFRTEWQALVDLGTLWSGRDYERAGSYGQAALDVARRFGEPQELARSLNQLANWYGNRDEPERALSLHREALALFEAQHDRAGIAETLDFLGMASYLSCDCSASTRFYDRSIALLRELDDRQRLSAGLAAMAVNGGDLDCAVAAPAYREAAFWIQCGEEALTIARDIGWPVGQALAHFVLSSACGARGELGRALREGEAGRDVAGRVGHLEWLVAAHHALGHVWLLLLDLDRAGEALEQSLALARKSGSRFWITTAASAYASFLSAGGMAARANSTLESVGAPALTRSMGQRQLRFVQAELALAGADPLRALEIIDQLDEPAPDRPDALSHPKLTKLRGDALARLERFEQAERAYRTARDTALLFGYLPLLWRIDTALGALHWARGNAAAAAEAHGQARTTKETLANSVPDAAIRSAFRERAATYLPAEPGVTFIAEPATRLSPRELEVLRLLSEGMSDREIAATLRISPRTVNRHVAGIFNKLGVNSRTAAAALAIRSDLL